ncbi:alpha-L-rhamnosidase C-terminal domain-containing protein [Pedobacter sp. P26]|uniref:alpha-L-rhamnosidase C-terminal domain-containing protein n=1 Tax=Pedobacter sp. P26 TaxID=3423956 RepID=UPI003D67FB7E
MDEDFAGFSKLIIAPVFPKGLDWVSATHKTPFGLISVKWKRVLRAIELHVDIPDGLIAKLGVKGYERQLEAGKHKILIK